jgi:two-component system sensor histidine kinase EvgS
VAQTSALKILHIDDVEINLLVLDQMLSMLGHSPVGAATGAAAFELIESTHFDLVLTDFHMPDVTGLDFLKNVKALREPARSTPVVVVTADALRKVIAAISAGSDQFVGDGFARAVSAR